MLVKTYSYTIANTGNLIGYATRYLFVNIYRLAASNEHKFVFTKTIRLLVLNFLKISSSYNLIVN